jgi:hypothetical protein
MSCCGYVIGDPRAANNPWEQLAVRQALSTPDSVRPNVPGAMPDAPRLDRESNWAAMSSRHRQPNVAQAQPPFGFARGVVPLGSRLPILVRPVVIYLRLIMNSKIDLPKIVSVPVAGLAMALFLVRSVWSQSSPTASTNESREHISARGGATLPAKFSAQWWSLSPTAPVQSVTLTWDGQKLNYELTRPPAATRQFGDRKVISPSADAWKEFWQGMDEVRAPQRARPQGQDRVPIRWAEHHHAGARSLGRSRAIRPSE